MPRGPVPTVPLSGDGTLHTVAEVAAHLRTSEMTVYRLIHTNLLHATRVGRSWRITAEDVADYLDRVSSRNQPTPQDTPQDTPQAEEGTP